MCDQLKEVEGLENGFDGIGFSQGGLFLRAYAERCNDPPLKTLVTFGSPHNGMLCPVHKSQLLTGISGIEDLPACGEHDWFCKKRNQLIKSQAYTRYAQTHSVTAQYFRVSFQH